MLFDVHQDLIKRLMREAKVGKRDVEFSTVKLGPNKVVRVSAKTENGVEFIRELQSSVPTIKTRDYVKRSTSPALRPNPVEVDDDDDDDDDEEDEEDDEELDEDEDEDEEDDEEDDEELDDEEN